MKNRLTILTAMVLSALSFLDPPAALAQLLEEEPNDSCPATQVVGTMPGLPATVSGSLDTDYGVEPPVFDVDFYTFETVPGSRLRVELRGAGSGVGTLGDPFVGVLGSDCSLIALNDDSVLGLESRLDLEVPGDGVFIVAATGCCDGSFTGVHGLEGSYELHILAAPPAIGAISGRLVDAVSGEPLSGYEPPYAIAELFRCGDAGCFEYAAFIPIGDDGRFRVETNNIGGPLEVGNYLIAARADGYELIETGPFAVGVGEDYDAGDIPLEPPSLVFANVVPCADLPASGGVCNYSVDVRNNTSEPIRGLGWSNVQAYGTGSPLSYSFFPAQREQFARVGPRASHTLRFSFNVPSGVADGAFFCADGWFSDREMAFMGTLRNEVLFCVSKQQGTFTDFNTKAAWGLLKNRGKSGPADARR